MTTPTTTTSIVVHHQLSASSSSRPGTVAFNNADNIDISECSTNTEDYVTCTENSKQTSQGIKPGGAISAAAATQVPGSRINSLLIQECSCRMCGV